jgi:RHS repeat-associated protein
MRRTRQVLMLMAVGLVLCLTPDAAFATTSGATPPPAPAIAAAVGTVTNGLTIVPGEVIESPSPPPTETVEYYAIDAIGSTRVVFAPNGAVLGRADYLPFGETLTGANLPPEQFTGQQRDAEAGLDNFGARAYQPRLGRFTRSDPLAIGALIDPQRWNRYSYALNNPLLFVDPDGRQAAACTSTGILVPNNNGTLEYEPNADKDCQAMPEDVGLFLFLGNLFFPTPTSSSSNTVVLPGSGPAKPPNASTSTNQPTDASGASDDGLPPPPNPNTDMISHAAPTVMGVGAGGAAGALGATGVSLWTRLLQAVGLGKLAVDEANQFRFTKTVSDGMYLISNAGRYSRPYLRSPGTQLLIQEIMSSGPGIADPGGLPSALRYDAAGFLNGSYGNWELVVDPQSKMVYHFLFTSVK